MAFNAKAIKQINNEIKSKPGNNYQAVTLSESNIPVLVVITGCSIENGIVWYTWSGKKQNGNSLSDDVFIGKSGISTRALCIEEMGLDMTGKVPHAHIGDRVTLFRDSNLCCFSVGARGNTDIVLDLSVPSNDSLTWVPGEHAVKLRFLQSQLYSPDCNIEYYRILTFNTLGMLVRVEAIVSVDGFETTLHEHI